MKYIYTLLFASLTLLTACDDKADPFRNESDNVKNAEVKPTAEEPTPGIDENAMSITLIRDLDSLYFEEGTEYSYEVNVRLYLPNLDFDAELVGAPEGMTLELRSEFNTEVVTAPTDPNATPVDPNAPPVVVNTDVIPPASVANQKIYVIKWNPTFNAIPDSSIPSITRFVSIKVNVGKDKQRSKEFRYTLTQATEKLRVTSFTVTPDLREGEKRGTARVYVKYPGLQTNNYPPIYFENSSNSSSTFAACANLPRSFTDMRVTYINNPNDPNYENIEYIYNMDLTRFDISTMSNSVVCSLNVYVDNLGNLSNPLATSVTVLNSITDPKTDWAENVELQFEQETATAFYFSVFGVMNEGTMSLNFVTPCKKLFDNQGDCKCRTNTASNLRHRIDCLVEVTHKKTFSPQNYTLEFEAQMSNGPLSSRKVNFKRRVKFGSGLSFFGMEEEEVPAGTDGIIPPKVTTGSLDLQ